MTILPPSHRSFSTKAGIAIAPVLFVIAMLAVIVGALAAGGGNLSGAATGDRIKADVRGQANLIRAKVQECYMATMGNAEFDYPPGPTPSGVVVRSMICPGDPSTPVDLRGMWTGKRPSALPPVPKGFNDWKYFNYTAGRCILLVPTAAPGPDVQTGLQQMAAQFGPTEAFLNTGGDYSFSVWLTPLATPKKCGT